MLEFLATLIGAWILWRVLFVGVGGFGVLDVLLLPFVSCACILVSGTFSHLAVLLLSGIALEVIVDIHRVRILILARGLDIAWCCIVGVRRGVVLRRLVLVRSILLLFRLLFFLWFNFLIDLVLAASLFLGCFFILFDSSFFSCLLLELSLGRCIIRVFIPIIAHFLVLDVFLLFFNVRQIIQVITGVVLLSGLLLLVHFLLGLYILFFHASFILLLLGILFTRIVNVRLFFAILFLGVLVSSQLLIILLLPLGLLALLVFLGLLFVISIPHLLVDSSRIKVINISSLFVHVILLLLFIPILRSFFVVLGTVNTTHISLKLFIRHIDSILFIFHFAILLFVSFLSKLREVFIGLDVLANVFGTFAVTEASAGFHFAGFTRGFIGLFLRGAESLSRDLSESLGHIASAEAGQFTGEFDFRKGSFFRGYTFCFGDVGKSLVAINPPRHGLVQFGEDVCRDLGSRRLVVDVSHATDVFVRKALLYDLLRLLAKNTAELPDNSEEFLMRLASTLAKSIDIGVLPACHEQDILHLLLNRKASLLQSFLHDLLVPRGAAEAIKAALGSLLLAIDLESLGPLVEQAVEALENHITGTMTNVLETFNAGNDGHVVEEFKRSRREVSVLLVPHGSTQERSNFKNLL
ncbi:hypothetical protein HG531_004176 [Fusarium graminearum]|nr:hypothetical protein HG531_004176 [Fusarium graminearum]